MNSIVIFSHPQTNKSLLQQLIAARSPVQSRASDATGQLLLVTKYYDAPVSICSIDSVGSLKSDENNQHQALIALYHDADSLNFVKQELADAEDLLSAIDTKLLVATLATGARDLANQHDRNISEWCIDMGIEHMHVELDEEKSNAGASTAASPLLEEKQGIDRIIEALECTMWPQMIRKQRSSGQTAASAEPGERVDTSENQTGEEETEDQEFDNLDDDSVFDALHSANQKESAFLGEDGVVVDSADVAEQAPMDTAPKSAEQTSQQPQKTNAAQSASQSIDIERMLREAVLGGAESDEDRQLQEFDSLMADMLKLKHSGDNVNHDERKKRAADLAMKMYEMFGLGDDSEGSSDEDDDGDDVDE